MGEALPWAVGERVTALTDIMDGPNGEEPESLTLEVEAKVVAVSEEDAMVAVKVPGLVSRFSRLQRPDGFWVPMDKFLSRDIGSPEFFLYDIDTEYVEE